MPTSTLRPRQAATGSAPKPARRSAIEPVLRPVARRLWLGLDAHAVDPHRLRNILDLLLAQKIEPAGKLALDGVVDGGGDTNPAALGEGLQSRGDVDAISIDRAVGLSGQLASAAWVGHCPSARGTGRESYALR